MKTTTLLIATAHASAQLELFLAGLPWWRNLNHIDNVVLVVNNSNGNNATDKVLRLAGETRDSGLCDVFVYYGDRGPGNGLGQAIAHACAKYPADRYVKVDDDTYPITTDWVDTLVDSALTRTEDLATAIVNVNSIGSKPFIKGLGLEWTWPSDRIDYKDIGHQKAVWDLTLNYWDRVVGWPVCALPDVRTRSIHDLYLISANAYTFTDEWFNRRTLESWSVLGEDERVLNSIVEGDSGNIVFDQSTLLLQWGYTPALGVLAPMWDDFKEMMMQHWMGE